MSTTISIRNSKLHDVRLAIFDKDGTLIDVHAYWANMVKYRAERIIRRLGLDDEIKFGIMESMGVDVGLMRIKPEGPVGLKKREIVLQAGVNYLDSRGFTDMTKLFEQVFAEVDAFSLDKFDKIIQPLNGLFTLFEQLRNNNCLIALATTDRSDRAALAMQHLGLHGQIDFIAGADLVNNPKPARDIIDIICEQTGIKQGHSIMVGDSASDVKTGINAECLASIGVASGLTSAEDLQKLTPYVVDDMADIIISN